jgi:hypothetical protein
MMRHAVVWFVLLLAPSALAQPVLLGGESGSMGGAGAASATDGGVFLINPAGMARVGSTRVSLSASIYGLSRLKVANFFNDGPTASTAAGTFNLDDVSLTSNAFVGFPSQASVMIGFGPGPGEPGHMVVGGSLLIPESSSRFFQGKAVASNTTARDDFEWSHEDTEVHFGPSFAIQLGRRLFVGASLFGVAFSFTNLVQGPFVLSDSTGTVYSSSETKAVGEGMSFDMLAVVGAQFQLNDAIAVGLALSTPSWHLGGDFAGKAEWRTFGTARDFNRVSFTNIEGETTYGHPFKARVGASYRRAGRFGVALDLAFIAPRGDAQVLEETEQVLTLRPTYKPETTEATSTSSTDSVFAVELNLGAEYYLKPKWILRGGFFLDRPTRPDFPETPTSADVLDLRLAHYGGSLGLSKIEGVVQSTLGVAFVYGTGTTVGLNFAEEKLEDSYRETPVRSIDVLFYITGGIDLTELTRAVKSKLGAPK